MTTPSPLDPGAEEAVLHAFEALLETRHATEEHGADPLLTDVDLHAAATRSRALIQRLQAKETAEKATAPTDDEFEFAVAWMLLSESSKVAFRGAETVDGASSSTKDPDQVVLEATDSGTGAEIVVIASGDKWVVRVVGATRGRYVVEVSSTGKSVEASGEINIVSRRPHSVTLGDLANRPAYARLRGADPK